MSKYSLPESEDPFLVDAGIRSNARFADRTARALITMCEHKYHGRAEREIAYEAARLARLSHPEQYATLDYLHNDLRRTLARRPRAEIEKKLDETRVYWRRQKHRASGFLEPDEMRRRLANYFAEHSSTPLAQHETNLGDMPDRQVTAIYWTYFNRNGTEKPRKPKADRPEKSHVPSAADRRQNSHGPLLF